MTPKAAIVLFVLAMKRPDPIEILYVAVMGLCVLGGVVATVRGWLG
jgi:hypothetical protein